MTNYEPSRRELKFRLNPTLEHQGDVWRYLHEQDSSWLLLEASEFPQLAEIQAALTVDGAMTIPRLASQCAIGEEVIAGLADAGMLWPAIDWPAVCADPWEALTFLTAQLREPDLSRWRLVIDRLRVICRDLSANWSTCEPDWLVQTLNDARSAMNTLIAHYRIGADPG